MSRVKFDLLVVVAIFGQFGSNRAEKFFQLNWLCENYDVDVSCVCQALHFASNRSEENDRDIAKQKSRVKTREYAPAISLSLSLSDIITSSKIKSGR